MPETETYAIAAIAVVGIGLSAGAYLAFTQESGGFAECGGGVATGGATIGGPFALIDETGANVTEADVIDKPTLLYFGYTFCPDVCPVDAANMAAADDILAAAGKEVNTVFVSVDPERDTPPILADFTDNLHPDMVGLTGAPEDVAAAARAYRVYYQKVDGDDPDFYLMDHSAFIYLVDPVEGFLDIFRHGESPDAIAEKTSCYLDALPGA